MSCVTALPPATADPHVPPPLPPPHGPPDEISALIKMSSSEAGGAVDKGSENSNCLLGTVPGALEVSGREASVGV